jgi:uncharacterized protein involved in exopolysaccharide biosynthesis
MARKLPASEGDLDLSRLDDDDQREASGMALADWGRLALYAAGRRKLLVIGVFLLGMAGAFVVYVVKTPVYRAETSILAQRQQALPSVVRSAVPDDSPTRGAVELIRRKENLVSMLKQANLLEESKPLPRPGVLESLSARSAASDEDPLGILVKRLDRSLSVFTNEATITIQLDWPDPLQAYQLVEAALQNFLEARQIQEVNAIDDAISHLTGRLAPLRAQLDAAIEEAQREGMAAAEPASHRTPSARPLPSDSAQSEELGRLRATIEAKERAIRDTEEFRRRRLLELQSQLEERRVVYSEAHPIVVSLRTEINALLRESPQVVALREEELRLRAELAARTGDEARARAAVGERGAGPRRGRPVSTAVIDQSERVREARYQFQQMVERLNAAQVDLDHARAAFKYRYKIVWPAEVPRRPVSPNPFKYLAAGTIASLLLALFVAAAPELWKGRVVERWQVERGLGIPVLADLDRH